IFTILLIFLIGGIFSVQSEGATTVTLSSIAHTETTITLSWTESQDRYFVNYTLYMGKNVNGPYSAIWNTTDKTTTTYAVQNLDYSSTYYFYIVDQDIFGSARSNTYEANTTSPPQLKVNSVTQTTVSLTWIDNNTYSQLVPFISYTVEMKTPTGGNWSTVNIINSASSNSYTVTGLSPGSTYYFRIYDSVGSPSSPIITFSNEISAIIIPLLTVSISSSNSNIMSGQSAHINALANGGYPPYNYTWYVNGNPVQVVYGSDFVFNTNTPGTYNIYVSVKDSSGTNVNSNTITITVESNSIFSSSSLWIIIGIIIVIIIVIFVLFIFRKTNRRW
ncbi:MAG: fibronectin type III domain-containing protein, partial [Thermoplasmata archaeon]